MPPESHAQVLEQSSAGSVASTSGYIHNHSHPSGKSWYCVWLGHAPGSFMVNLREDYGVGDSERRLGVLPHAQEIKGQILPEKKCHMGGYADVWRGRWTPPGGETRSVREHALTPQLRPLIQAIKCRWLSSTFAA